MRGRSDASNSQANVPVEQNAQKNHGDEYTELLINGDNDDHEMDTNRKRGRDEEIIIGTERDVRARLDKSGRATTRIKKSKKSIGYQGNGEERMPQKGEEILVRKENSQEWEKMIIKGRGGKVGKGNAKNTMYFNLR